MAFNKTRPSSMRLSKLDRQGSELSSHGRPASQSLKDQQLSARRSGKNTIKSTSATWWTTVPCKFISGKPQSGTSVVTQRVANAFMHSMDPSTELLDASEALEVLCDVGLLPRSQEERRVVTTLLEEEGVEAGEGLTFE